MGLKQHWFPCKIISWGKQTGESVALLVLLDLSTAFDTVSHNILMGQSSSAGDAAWILEHCLTSMIGWMTGNKLKQNPGKTEILLLEGIIRLVIGTFAWP